VENANQSVTNSEVAYNDTIAKNNQLIDSAETSLSNAKDYLESAEDYYEGVQRDYDRGVATKSQLTSAELTVTQAENSVNSAEESLKTAKTQADIEKNAAQANLDQARNQLENAKDALQSVTLEARMQENNAQSHVDTSNVALLIADQLLKSTEAQVNSKLENAFSDVDTARGALDSAKANLELTRKSIRDVDLKPQQAIVEQAQIALDQSKEKLNETKIIAPIDGMVVAINGEVGEFANAGAPIVKLLGENNLQIEANIPETDIYSVKLDDITQINFDALSSDEMYAGKVVEIEPDATVISGVIYYKITIELDEPDDRIKTGMTANIDVISERKENVLRLPLRAIKDEEGTQYVEILQNGVPLKKEVEVGLKGDTFYEILSGVSEGEEIITFVREK
jgi:HlyD family secretion protein